MTDFKRVYMDTSPMIYYLEHSAFLAKKSLWQMCFCRVFNKGNGGEKEVK